MRISHSILILGLFFIPFSAALAQTDHPKPKAWASFQEPDYGATLYYPSNWFHSQKPQDGGFVFSSRLASGASLFLKTEFDEQRTGAAETVLKLKSGTGAHRIKDLKVTETSYEIRLIPRPNFVQVSRVVYSCKERVVSAVTLIYPDAQAKAYEAMFQKLKRRFSVGIGVKTPVRSCS